MEKFINYCIAKDIYLWDIRRVNYTVLEASIGISGFKTVKRLARKAGCKVTLTEKNGYPFWVHKIKKRKMLLVGAFFSLLMLIVASSFIYHVDVVGNETVETEAILEYLDELGVGPGSNRYLIDLREVERELLLKFNQLAWAGIELKGIYAKVEVVEKSQRPEPVEKDIPAHVVAAKNGIIERVIARNGDAIVKEGDIVTEGDLLITGIITRPFMEGNMVVHAYGEVFARTYYETTKSMELITMEKVKTGEIFKNYRLRLGKLNLSFGDSQIPFEKYVVSEERQIPTLWRKIKLPVEIVVINYEEVYEEEREIPLMAAKEAIHSEAISELLEKIPLEAEIVQTKVEFQQVGQVLQGTVTIEVIEDIAKQIRIE